MDIFKFGDFVFFPVCLCHHGLLLQEHHVPHDVGELLLTHAARVETLSRLMNDERNDLVFHNARIGVVLKQVSKAAHEPCRTRESRGTATGVEGTGLLMLLLEGVHTRIPLLLLVWLVWLHALTASHLLLLSATSATATGAFELKCGLIKLLNFCFDRYNARPYFMTGY